MSELPQGWALANLGEMATFVMGQAPPGHASNFEGVGTPFVKAGEFGPLRPIIREWTTQPLKMAAESDVFICVVGATSGKINLGADCAIGRSVAAIRPSEGINQFYLHDFMKTQVDALRSGSTGTAQGVISSVMLSNVVLPIAPFPEQQRIVAKVDGLAARTARARKELDRIPTLIARYKQRLLALLYSDFDSKIKVDHLPFSDVVSSAQNGISKRRGDTGRMTNVLRLADLTNGHFVGDDPREIMLTAAEEEKYGLEIDDLICIRVNGSEKLVGRMLVWEGKLNWAFCDHFIRFKTNSKVCLSKYVSYFFASDVVRAQIESSFVSSAGQKTVSQGTLGRILVPVPPIKEQAEIVRRIESAFGWLDRMAADHATAARLLPKLDAAILAKAFRGELVPQDPNDEPADELLERIKAEREVEGKKPKSGRGRKPNGSKEQLMTEKALLPRDRLLTDSEKWPADGLSFEAIAMRNPMPHDALRDGLFELLSGSSPALQQRFDTDAEVMVIQRVAA